MGLGNVGTRQIAAAHAEGGDVAVGRTRRALFWGTMLLALIGAVLFWLASGWIARVILADESRATDVAWLSLGVALTVAAGSQGALLTGLRRIGDLARINIGAGVVGAALGVLALWFWGAHGLIAMVLIAPVVTFLLGSAMASYLLLVQTQHLSVARSQAWNAALALAESGIEDAKRALLKYYDPATPAALKSDRSTSGRC